jgi:hypothetical protein
MKYTFREFLQLDEETKTSLGTIQVNEDLSNNQKEKKMKTLEQKLKTFDWWWTMSSDMRSYKKGQKEQDVIRSLVDELGDDGKSLYRQYGQKNGVTFRESVEKKEPGIDEYEKFVLSQMKKYGIKSLKELDKDTVKKFWNEIDRKWKGENEVEVNIPEKKSMFPEQNVSTKNIQLGYGEERPVDGRSKHGFVDTGNLYYNQPQWTPPSKERKKHYE